MIDRLKNRVQGSFYRGVGDIVIPNSIKRGGPTQVNPIRKGLLPSSMDIKYFEVVHLRMLFYYLIPC